MKLFRDDFYKILELFKKGEHFAFQRFSDGELRLLQGKELVLAADYNKIGNVKKRKRYYVEEDRKDVHPDRNPEVYERLMNAFLFKKHNYFVGISCKCCVGHKDFQWMLNLYGGEDEFVTWSNLFVNANYPLFREHFIPELQKKDVVIVCSEKGDINGLPFKVVKDFRVGNNCIVNDYWLALEIGAWIEQNKIKNHIFLFSASSLSNMLIHTLYKHYDENTYMDIGTTFNQDMGMKSVRSYQIGGKYARKRCVW